MLTKILVKNEDVNKRVDVLSAESTGITRAQIQKLISNGLLLVNSKRVKQNYEVRSGDIIVITSPQKEHEVLVPEPIPIEVLYKDEDVVVVNKPFNMVVYPAAGHSSGTLMNALLYICKKLANIGGPLRPGVVHRLDKDTSGVMVVALNDKAYYALVAQFRQRTVKRKYLALIHGNPEGIEGEIALSIGRSGTDRKKMSTKAKKSKGAVTTWRVIKRFASAALIEAKLKTGRTHQIRVHFASIGHPVLGDSTYGRKTEINTGNRKKIMFNRQMLHAELLGFIHPETGEYLEFRSPLPEDMAEKIKELSA